MGKGLNETTMQKMTLEKKINREIDCYVNEFRKIHKFTVSKSIEFMEKIRLYREKIFELKCQAEDFNKLYDKLEIPDFFPDNEATLFPNIHKSRDHGNTEITSDICDADAVRFYFLIYNYYEQLIVDLEQALFEEKAENYNIQKKFDSKEEDILELQ